MLRQRRGNRAERVEGEGERVRVRGYKRWIPRRRRLCTSPIDLLLRMGLVLVFAFTEVMDPFIREIQPEEMYLYRYPSSSKSFLAEFANGYLHHILGPMAMIAYPLILIGIFWWIKKDPTEAEQAGLSFTLSVPVTGIVVNIIKVFAGRPRPDFLVRCYGLSYYLRYNDMSRPCFTDSYHALDGRKSFPSGHSALAACCFGWLALYLSGQLKTYRQAGKHHLSSVLVILPILMLPVIVGISRTCDYKHHWQDVLVGGIIGFFIAYVCYRVYFPPVTSEGSERSYLGTRLISASSSTESFADDIGDPMAYDYKQPMRIKITTDNQGKYEFSPSTRRRSISSPHS